MQDRGLLCLHCPLCAFHTSVISTGALFEAVTSNPSAVTGCRASSQSNLQRQLCNHGPGSGGQLRKKGCASLAEYSGSWWRRRHGWGGSRNRYFEVSPRQTKKELEEKKTEWKAWPVLHTTSHSVWAICSSKSPSAGACLPPWKNRNASPQVAEVNHGDPGPQTGSQLRWIPAVPCLHNGKYVGKVQLLQYCSAATDKTTQ